MSVGFGRYSAFNAPVDLALGRPATQSSTASTVVIHQHGGDDAKRCPHVYKHVDTHVCTHVHPLE